MEEKRIREDEKDDYAMIRKYLLGDKGILDNAKKPILWIHVPYEYNTRRWVSFGSRSTMDLNQPYLYFTVKSIIDKCGDSFHICIVDDDSFAKLIPDWSIDVSKLGQPILEKVRMLGLTRLLYLYGGLLTPISFLCFHNLRELYLRKNTMGGKDSMFVVENVDHHVSSTFDKFAPDIGFMGCSRESKIMENLNHYIQTLLSEDVTSESFFLGKVSQWCYIEVQKKTIELVDGKLVGTKNMQNNPILLDDLMSSTKKLDLFPKTYGIWIPEKQILMRRHYEWFARLSEQQILEASPVLCRYFNSIHKTRVIEIDFVENFQNIGYPDLEVKPIKKMEKYDNNWVGFWKVASGAPVWGMKPLNQGDETVMQIPYPDN
jgi:hypothetical protein